MWNWACHVRHNWQSNLLREEIKKVETLWQKQSKRKGKVPKIYDKNSHIQKRKQLTKEGVVSFWRLGKYVIGKVGNFWQKMAQFPFGVSITKVGQSRKFVIDKSINYWHKEITISNFNEWHGQGNNSQGSLLANYSRREHIWLGLEFYEDYLLS